jgi:ATP-dependent protease ClpP protease subunit
MERDKFLSPEEAVKFGMIDEVIVKRPPREDAAKS